MAKRKGEAAAAEKKKEEKVDPRSLAAILAEVEKEYGTGVVVPAVEAVLDIHRIPTGIFPLDLALAGGYPAGRVTLVIGRKASGKTTSVLKAIAAWQQLCHRCWAYHSECACPEGRLRLLALWNDIEGVYDHDWASACGVDESKEALYLCRPRIAEEGIDVAAALIRANEVGLMAMDSLAMLLPSREVEASALDQFQGLHPRLVNRLVRNVGGALNEAWRAGRSLTILYINQLREKMTGFGPVAERPPGGHGQIFQASVVLHMTRTGYQFLGEEKEKGGEKSDDGKPKATRLQGAQRATTKFKVLNSKVSRPGAEGMFTLALTDVDGLHAADADDMQAVFAAGHRTGYLAVAGKDMVRPRGESNAISRTELAMRWLSDRPAFARAKQEICAAVCARV